MSTTVVVVVIAAVVVVGAFLLTKKSAPTVTPVTPPTPSPSPAPVAGTTTYDVFVTGGTTGDVTYVNAAGQTVTETITPPSIRITVQNGTTPTGNYGQLVKVA